MKRVVLIALGLLAVAGCKPKERWYEAEIEITRLDVRKDQKGIPVTSDVEMTYPGCPGKQLEVIRGGAEFAACMTSRKVGDKVKAKIRWHDAGTGYYRSDIYQLAECARTPDPEDEASYQLSRACDDWKINGVTVGFRCKYADKEKLTAACPWFEKR